MSDWPAPSFFYDCNAAWGMVETRAEFDDLVSRVEVHERGGRMNALAHVLDARRRPVRDDAPESEPGFGWRSEHTAPQRLRHWLAVHGVSLEALAAEAAEVDRE